MRDGERPTQSPRVQLVDVLERVLTKGIVIVYDVDVSVLGLRLVEIDGHVVILSLETYAQMQDPVAAETETSEALMSAVGEYLHRVTPTDTPPATP